MPDPSAAGGPAQPTILIVDDERNIRRTLDMVLRGDGYDVAEAPDAETALALLESGERHVDLAILDINLPGMSGVELLSQIRRDEVLRDLPVIVISGHAAREDVAQAIKLGAADFFEKPLGRERVLVSVQNALRASQISRRLASLSAEVEPRYQVLGQSAPIQRLLDQIQRVAPTATTVLVTGETGTGKELVARALHRLSPRALGPFVRVNCAAIPRALLENELFGHERGSFTGAAGQRRGLFEGAHGGTLFLDEISEMDAAAQAKVLRAVESREIVRVGGARVVPIDVRIVAATHEDLERRVVAGTFRRDLYFRLAVFPLRCPSLSERPEDIPLLADAFLAAFCRDNGLRAKALAPEAHAALAQRAFPGNVRELRNVVERAAILAGEVITVADLPEDPHRSPFEDDPAEEGGARAPNVDALALMAGEAGGTMKLEIGLIEGGSRVPTPREVRDSAERVYLRAVLERTGWNIFQTARALGVERTNLQKRIRSLGITRPG